MLHYIYHTLFLSSLLFFAGCKTEHAPTYQEGYTYRNIYFGKNLSNTYKHGIRDGCETSRGVYTKSHQLFNDDNDYYNGWFIGRNRCKDLLQIDKNGDLVL